MNNEFNTMMREMVQTMMMSMLKETMSEMMSEMMPKPQVASAEATEPLKVATHPKVGSAISREEWLERHSTVKETKEVIPVDMSALDFVGFENSSTRAYFNLPNIPSDVWAINFLTVKRFNGRWSNNLKCFVFSKAEDCKRFLGHAQIIKELTAEDYDKIIAYKSEKLDEMGKYDRERAEKIIEKWKGMRDALIDNK